jgi:uncharacterized Fe-S cluster-containing protein
MKNEGRVAPEQDYTDEELAVFGDFSEAQRDGKNPDIEEFLRRVPESADRLRAILETVVRLCAEVEKLRIEYPGVDLARLLDPDWRPKGG